MSKSQLEALANQYATKLTWLHSTGKNTEEPETYKSAKNHSLELMKARNLSLKLKKYHNMIKE